MTKPKVISEKVVYESALTKVFAAKVQLSNGKEVEWDYINNANAVAVLPIDGGGNVYLCKEWRIAYKKYLLQIPAGTCTAEDEEGRLNQVHNELREEISMDARKVTKLISYVTSARINYIPHIYLAQDLFPAKKDPDEDEILEVIKMPFEEAYELFVSGREPSPSYTLVAFLMAKEKLGK